METLFFTVLEHFLKYQDYLFLESLKEFIYEVGPNAVLRVSCLKHSWDFPGSPVVKIPCFHCRGHGFNP